MELVPPLHGIKVQVFVIKLALSAHRCANYELEQVYMTFVVDTGDIAFEIR